jgi:hypothetical protein
MLISLMLTVAIIYIPGINTAFNVTALPKNAFQTAV